MVALTVVFCLAAPLEVPFSALLLWAPLLLYKMLFLCALPVGTVRPSAARSNDIEPFHLVSESALSAQRVDWGLLIPIVAMDDLHFPKVPEHQDAGPGLGIYPITCP